MVRASAGESFTVLRVLSSTAEPLMVRASAGESFKVLRVLSSVRLRSYERRSRLCGKLAQLPLVGQHLHNKQAKSKQKKQTNKQTSKQTNKQTNKQTSKQTSKQANKQAQEIDRETDRTENLRDLRAQAYCEYSTKSAA
jgi:hypothetical protein